jgi:hypothetical protein
MRYHGPFFLETLPDVLDATGHKRREKRPTPLITLAQIAQSPAAVRRIFPLHPGVPAAIMNELSRRTKARSLGKQQSRSSWAERLSISVNFGQQFWTTSIHSKYGVSELKSAGCARHNTVRIGHAVHSVDGFSFRHIFGAAIWFWRMG